MGGRVNNWNAEEDAIFHGIYRYLKATLDIGAVCQVNPRDFQEEEIKAVGRADSDFCGDETRAKSRSGWTVCYSSYPTGAIAKEVIKAYPDATHGLMDWSAKRQPCAACATPDAEEEAMPEMITRALGPFANFNEQVPTYGVQEEVGTDNAVAMAVSKSGVSKRLAYYAEDAARQPGPGERLLCTVVPWAPSRSSVRYRFESRKLEDRTRKASRTYRKLSAS